MPRVSFVRAHVAHLCGFDLATALFAVTCDCIWTAIGRKIERAQVPCGATAKLIGGEPPCRPIGKHYHT